MHADAASNIDGCAVDECGVVGNEEDDQPGNILWFLETTNRRVAEDVIEVALLERRPGARRLQECRRHVDAGDASRAKLVGNGPRETQHRTYAGYVMSKPRGTHPDRVGADIDDLALTLRRHGWHNGLRGQVGPFDVDGKAFSPVGQR